MKRHLTSYTAMLCVITCGLAAPAFADQAPLVLYDFDKGFKLDQVEPEDVEVSLITGDTGQALRIVSGHKIPWPNVTFRPADRKWDLTGYREISIDVRNPSNAAVSVGLRADTPGGVFNKDWIQAIERLDPHETATISLDLNPSRWMLDPPTEIVGMRSAPGQMRIDPASIVKISVFVPRPKKSYEFVIDNIRATGRVQKIGAEEFFPFIDEYGQYVHRDWPGKIHSEEDFAARKAAEARDLEAHPGPPDRNKYGGWTAGPQLEATGSFRTAKYKDKWWLVDPEGWLFWSHGVDGVMGWNETGTTDRERYFKGLPAKDGPLGRFYGVGRWAPHGYYKGKTPFTVFTHQNANLLRKYGQNWPELYADIAHLRLRSWGMNTIANWSRPIVYLQHKTPYVATMGTNSKKIEGSSGYWAKFPDVFDPSFRAAIRNALSNAKRIAGDPWCIGFFVDNELAWGSKVSLALATLKSPAEQPAKKVFVDRLRAKYGTIDKLNSTWGTEHASWDALLASGDPPDAAKAGSDLVAFYTDIAETYFKTVKEELAAAAPGRLYLGCRFSGTNDVAQRAAIKYCDVISYNSYTFSVEDLDLPGNGDKPVIIGEFHFGALNVGMFHTGLRKARSQTHRGHLYKSYVRSALRNPLIVGTHWFRYVDQPTAGRGDGENFQVGFLDICDTPYEQMVHASRDIGKMLYEYRLGVSGKTIRRRPNNAPAVIRPGARSAGSTRHLSSSR